MSLFAVVCVLLFYADSADICKERGHIKGMNCISNAVYNAPKVVDLPEKTLIIFPGTMTCYCIRCYKAMSSPPDTMIAWEGPRLGRLKMEPSKIFTDSAKVRKEGK